MNEIQGVKMEVVGKIKSNQLNKSQQKYKRYVYHIIFML